MPSSNRKGTEQILEAPIGGMLWRLALPNVVAVAMMTAVTFADAWYAGQLGINALASLALVFPFLTLMQMMSGGAIGGGITSAVGRALGAGNKVRAEVTAWHAVIVCAVLSVIFMTVFGAFARPVYVLLGGRGEALEGAVKYSHIVFGGAAATWLGFGLAAIFRGAGDTVTPGRAITTTGAIQICLSGALVLGWFGLPKLGLSGAAVAWVVCQGSMAVYLLAYLWSGRGRLRLRPHGFDWAPVRDIMKVGGMGLINSSCLALTVAVVTGFIGRFGNEALAGYGLGGRLELMLVPISFGVGAALTAAVGINVGAGQYQRARRIAWTGAAATFVVTGLIGGTVAVKPELWLDLFTTDAEAFDYGKRYLLIAGPFYALFGAGQAFYFASQGTGRMLLQVSVTFSRLLVVAGLGALVLALGWNVNWLFAVAALGLTIMGVGQALCTFTAGWRGR